MPAAAQVTPAPAKVISTPGQMSTGPVITFHPSTGAYGIAYREPVRDQFVGAFLDQDGNRTTGAIRLTGDINGFEPTQRDVVPFPFSNAMLATFQLSGHPDLFDNNVFVGDAGSVAFASNGPALAPRRMQRVSLAGLRHRRQSHGRLAIACRRPPPNNLRPPRRPWSQHAVVQQEVDPRSRHEHRQPAQELDGVEHQVRRPIGPPMPELQHHPPVAGHPEPIARHR